MPALLLGSVLALAPGWILKLPSDTGFVGSLKWVGSYIDVPGGFVGLIASGGKIDDLNFVIVDISNCVFYSGLVYILLGIWRKQRVKTQHHVAPVQRYKS